MSIKGIPKLISQNLVFIFSAQSLFRVAERGRIQVWVQFVGLFCQKVESGIKISAIRWQLGSAIFYCTAESSGARGGNIRKNDRHPFKGIPPTHFLRCNVWDQIDLHKVFWYNFVFSHLLRLKMCQICVNSQS